MEAVLSLCTTEGKIKVPFSQIMTGILMAVCVCGLYLICFRHVPQETAPSAIKYIEHRDILSKAAPDFSDLKSLNQILKYPGELAVTIHPEKLPAEHAPDTDMTAADTAVADKKREEADVNISKVTADKQETTEKQEPEEDIPISVLVTFHGNGGTAATSELTLNEYFLDPSVLDKPRRLGKQFDGWYMDAACTIPFDGIKEGQTRVDLYAGWIEFPAFISDDRGYITGYSDAAAVAYDGVIVLPSSPDCLGVEAGAFTGLEDIVVDIFIPANIKYIAPGTLDILSSLIYIEVESGNPEYYSDGGILYNSDGTLYVYPAGRDDWNKESR